MPCYVYGQHVADTHLWPANTKVDKPRQHGDGPLCLRCGLPLGTYQYESAADRHLARTGHRMGTGACVDACDPQMDREWWDLEPATAEAPR